MKQRLASTRTSNAEASGADHRLAYISSIVLRSVSDAVDGSSHRRASALESVADEATRIIMQAIAVVGLDIAKSVFEVHGVNAHGDIIVRRQLKRRYVVAFFKKLPSCLVGIEACATPHHWSRELLALGHTVRLIPPAM
jgi:transposase